MTFSTVSQRSRGSSVPAQFLGADDLQLVRVDDVEIAGERRTPRLALARRDRALLAALARDPAHLQALLHFVEQLSGGDAFHKRNPAGSGILPDLRAARFRSRRRRRPMRASSSPAGHLF